MDAKTISDFKLSVLTGKQNSIEADFNSGIISQDNYIKLKNELNDEFNVYSSISGAARFLKGDTIVTILLTCINLLAVLYVISISSNAFLIKYQLIRLVNLILANGFFQFGISILMTLSFSIALTRFSAQKDTLGAEISQLLLNKPLALVYSSVFIYGIAILGFISAAIPGMWFLLISLFIGFIAFTVFISQDIQSQMDSLNSVKQNREELINPDRFYKELKVDKITIYLGYNLIKLSDPEQGGNLMKKY